MTIEGTQEGIIYIYIILPRASSCHIAEKILSVPNKQLLPRRTKTASLMMTRTHMFLGWGVLDTSENQRIFVSNTYAQLTWYILYIYTNIPIGFQHAEVMC